MAFCKPDKFFTIGAKIEIAIGISEVVSKISCKNTNTFLLQENVSTANFNFPLLLRRKKKEKHTCMYIFTYHCRRNHFFFFSCVPRIAYP